jgi:serine/threonine-protein kinase
VGEVVEDRYRIEAEIGSGAMGKVFRAKHVRVGREVAIKVLHGHLMRDPVMVERFEREAAIVARLHHKNLVNVIDVGETAGRLRYMVLDLVRGPSLAEVMKHSLLDRARVIHLTKQILAGLDHAHGAGLVHRDLKPENVIVERDSFGVEVPRIVDFGIATLRDTSAKRLTADGIILGTPAYMAPEQARGMPDPRTDLFALGVMVYEMLAGKQPFEGTSMEVVMANMQLDPPRISGTTDFDPLLEAFARKLMARDLRDRFATASEAREMLELVEHDRDAATAALGVAPRMPRGTQPPVRATASTEALPIAEDTNPLAKTIAMLRKRAEEERAAAITMIENPPRRWPILAALVLVVGGIIGWQVASRNRFSKPFDSATLVDRHVR